MSEMMNVRASVTNMTTNYMTVSPFDASRRKILFAKLIRPIHRLIILVTFLNGESIHPPSPILPFHSRSPPRSESLSGYVPIVICNLSCAHVLFGQGISQTATRHSQRLMLMSPTPTPPHPPSYTIGCDGVIPTLSCDVRVRIRDVSVPFHPTRGKQTADSKPTRTTQSYVRAALQ